MRRFPTRHSGVPARRLFLILSCLVVSACAADVTDLGEAGLRVVAGPSATDTVDAYPQQLLVVVVRDERGVPLEGVDVVYTSDVSPDAPATVASVYPVRQTGADGRAATRLRFGTVAGDAWLVIDVPSEGLSTRVHFRVQAGRPVQLVAPAQALTLGDTITPTVHGLDRHGNRSTLPVTLSDAEPPLALTADNRLRGTAYGTGTVTVQMLDQATTAGVTVVPQGWLAGYAVAGRDTFPAGLHRLTVDGRQGAPVPGALGMVEPNGVDWSPDGLFLAHGDVPENRIVLVNTAAGTAEPLAGTTGFTRAHSPRFSADGASVYFWGRDESGEGIWRAPTWGGSAPVLLVPDAPQDAHIAADGSRLAYAAGGAIVVQDVGTGAVQPLGVSGGLPRFSPDGRHIAFIDPAGALALLALGSGAVRTVPLTGVAYTLDWSPLGAWLLVGGSTAVQLVDFEGLQVLTLPYYLTYPTFRFIQETAPPLD